MHYLIKYIAASVLVASAALPVQAQLVGPAAAADAGGSRLLRNKDPARLGQGVLRMPLQPGR